MCLISYGPLPDKEILEEAEDSNPHGTGVAWRTKKGVEWLKGLKVADLLELPDWIKDECAVHFRQATVGGTTDDLIHPFPIEKAVPLAKSGRAARVLMHNGHWYKWDDLFKAIHPQGMMGLDGPISDSRAAAYMIYKMGADILHFITGQRFLVMSRHKVTYYGDWYQEGPRIYSNQSYRWKRRKDWKSTYTPGCHYYGVGGGGAYPRASDNKDAKQVVITSLKDDDKKSKRSSVDWEDDEFIWFTDKKTGQTRRERIADILADEGPIIETETKDVGDWDLSTDQQLLDDGWTQQEINQYRELLKEDDEEELNQALREGMERVKADVEKVVAKSNSNGGGPAPLGTITKSISERFKSGFTLLKGGDNS